jgi:cobalt-zinc-cadmium efflux system protein
VFAAVEAAAGVWSGSLALLSDAGHMVTDACALAVAALASHSASRKPVTGRPHGVEVLAAAFNSALMAAVIASIVIEALSRLHHPVAVLAWPMLAVALLGLAVNGLVAWIVSRGERTLNSRAALLHVMGDMLGSLGAVVAAVVILSTGWTPIDPLLSLFVSGLICIATINLLRQAWGATRGHRH